MDSRLPTANRSSSVLVDYNPGFDDSMLSEIHLSRFSENSLHSDDQVNEWVTKKLSERHLVVNKIPLSSLDRWSIDHETGNIQHDSGRFFSITGIKARHRTVNDELEWGQPMIDQPEIGILGILAKTINGTLHFCLQAKEEPGNINSVQLSPAVQATYSNYTCVHGGISPLFVEYFLSPSSDKVIFSKLQTEDGGRFLFKSNRNMIIRVGNDELNDLPNDFIWLTLHQIARLLSRDNLIHATTRSILSSMFATSPLKNLATAGDPQGYSRIDNCPPGTISRTIQWLDDMKAVNHMYTKREPLNSLTAWNIDDEGFFSRGDKRFFRILGLDVRAAGREVVSWRQPILENPETGVIGMLIKTQNNIPYYLMHAKAEAGNRPTVQLAPTVQFTPGNYLRNLNLPKPFLFYEFSNNHTFELFSESLQSEEGARFYKEQHLHRVMILPEGVDLEVPPDYRWLTGAEIQFFLHIGETVNSCARSLLACLL